MDGKSCRKEESTKKIVSRAGLTSNTAIILRDELSKDLPGIKLPMTLSFDYPSVAAIADFVMDQSKMIAG
eukprot:Skav210899  [mRNA]  locus=scaffold2900:206345:210882:+ [translate_table: standard]